MTSSATEPAPGRDSNIAIPAPDLTTILAPHNKGYLGADAVLSVPLPDGRTVWFFGDTIIGSIRDGKRTLDAMPRNTIAVQDRGAPTPSSIRLFLYDSQGKPKTYLRFPDRPEEQFWLWPGTAVYHNGCILAFCNSVTHAKGPCEALCFRVVDPWLARIHVTSGDPPDWAIEYEPLPWTIPHTLLSAACHPLGSFLYLLGTQRKHPKNQLTRGDAVLSRVETAALDRDARQWRAQYWSTTAQGPAWSDSPEALHPVFHPGTAETTLYYDAPRRRYMVTTYRPAKPDLFVLTAPALEGPWSEPIHIYTCTEGFPRERFLFYALRMHAHLMTSPDEMVLSYIVNARGLTDLMEHTDTYHAHFLRLDLRKI